ncbi:MAG: hypothetical protein L0Z53_27755 [Acidobacteriales bacterium]|nr:hypothetical protein [Terriglobales bacterium]
MQKSLPWNGIVVGDAGSYSDQEWAEAWRYIIGLASHRANVGVLLGTGDSGVDGLKVRATGPASANVEVVAGAAMVHGTMFVNDATATLTIAANGSGNPRIDTVILRKDFAAQTVRFVVKQGTPAASPTPPALTQIINVTWEIPLADIAVANGFLSITNADITLRAEPANAADGVYLDMVLNNSGVELNTGDVVIWDTGNNRAVTTTTSASNPLIAGVWIGRTANGSYGRVQTSGIGLVRVNGAVASRTSLLATSTTAKQAAVVTGGPGVFAQAIETTSGAGLCLAHLNTVVRSASSLQFSQTADQTYANSTTETTLFGTGVGTLTLPANSLAIGKVIRITMSGFAANVTGNITIALKLGGTTIESALATAFTTPGGVCGFQIDAWISVRAIGASGSVVGGGRFEVFRVTNGLFAAEGGGRVALGQTRAPVTVNTTTNLVIDVTADWSVANAGNTITCQQAFVEVL